MLSRIGRHILLFTLLCGSFAYSATYYVDYAGGADTNNGTSTSTPWKLAPGMVGCSNTCASTTVNAGDSVILKGGVTWPNAALWWQWAFSGTSGNKIYVGVDQAWYSGGSWSRPILDGGGAEVGGGSNMFLKISANYVTFDNIEFTGALWLDSGVPWGGNTYINPQTSIYVDITNCYFHGWSLETATTDPGILILSDSHLPSENVGMVIAYNVFDGADTAAVLADPDCTGSCQASGHAMWYGPIVHHNVCRYLSNCYVGAAETFNNNLVEHIRDSTDATNHENGFENNSDPCTGLTLYNNTFRTIKAGVTIWIAPQAGCTPAYVWNNVIYDTTAGNVFDLAAALTNPNGSANIYNNTIECGPDADASYQCMSVPAEWASTTITNNHFITSNATPVAYGGNTTYSNNVVQTKAQANAQGYTSGQTYGFSPTDGSDGTVGVGSNLTATCSSYASLCSDTVYGVEYVAVGHTAVTPGRSVVARPAEGAWDAGAYQYEAGEADTTDPVVTITSPTEDATYATSSSTINLSGTASDNVGVSSVTWANDRGGSGSATGTTSWSITGISLFEGDNVLTVTATDAASNTGTDVLTVTYTPPATSSRSAGARVAGGRVR